MSKKKTFSIEELTEAKLKDTNTDATVFELTPKPIPEPISNTYFTGSWAYWSPNGTSGFSTKPGPVTILKEKPGAAHPICVAHSDDITNVYGWVDSISIERR